MDEEATRLFFSPRPAVIQARLDFLSCPPERLVAFAAEATEFVGTMIHWTGGSSAMCVGADHGCKYCETTKAREYHFAAAYLFVHSTREFKRFILPVGEDLSDFFSVGLGGVVWKVSAKMTEKGTKKGLSIKRVSVEGASPDKLAALQQFEIRDRLLRRYGIK